MAINEKSVLLISKDADGNTNFLYPITTADNVDGLEELVDDKIAESSSDDIAFVVSGSEPSSTNTVWFDTSASV